MLKFDKKRCVGYVVSWLDPEPWGDSKPTDTKLRHTNNAMKFIAADYYRKYYDLIMTSKLSWVITLKILFETKQGVDVREYELSLFTAMVGKDSSKFVESISDCIQEAFNGNEAYPDEHKKKGNYMWCEFDAQIIGY